MAVMEEILETLLRVEEKLDQRKRPSSIEMKNTDLDSLKSKFADKEGLKDSEVAEYLGLGVSTIRKYKDEIPHIYIGQRLIFPKSTLMKWLEETAEENTVPSDHYEAGGSIIRKLS